MSPLLRVALAAACLGIGGGVGWLAVRAIAENVTAMRSWKRVDGLMRRVGGENGWVWRRDGATIQVYPSNDLSAMQEVDNYQDHPDPVLKAKFDTAFRTTSVMTDLGIPSTYDPIPLFINPIDPQRVKTAGFFQMWVFPATMLAWAVPLLAIGMIVTQLGMGGEPVDPDYAPARWMFTSPPPPLQGGIALKNPSSYWKMALCWSLLGVALCVLSLHPEYSISRTKTISGALVGALFAISVWISAWRDATLRITANDHGVRLVSITGWRDVRWEQVKGFQLQSIFTTYYSGQGMWELPAAGSIIKVYALTDANNRTLLSFGPEVIPGEGRNDLFRLCKAKTGVSVMSLDVPIKY